MKSLLNVTCCCPGFLFDAGTVVCANVVALLCESILLSGEMSKSVKGGVVWVFEIEPSVNAFVISFFCDGVETFCNPAFCDRN